MTIPLKKFWPTLLLGAALAVIVVLNIRPYAYNITGTFHMDAVTAEGNAMPPGFVILNVPSYDGAQYYQVARNIPAIANPYAWPELSRKAPGSYAYQRFLLPLTASLLSFGQRDVLPYAFLAINILALLGVSVIMLKKKIDPLFVLALCLSPAAMVAMHFTLAEPLTILLITTVLLRYRKNDRFLPLDILLLSLVVLAREINILFIGCLIGWSLLRKNWKDAVLLLIPAGSFLALHGLIYVIFGNMPFFISTGARQFPGSAAMKLVLGMKGYDSHTLSAVALFIGVVIPGIAWTLWMLIAKKTANVLTLGALAFFGVMLLMPDYIWGSITSIGRVITPVYPLYLLSLSERNTRVEQILAGLILLIGMAAALGLALSIHPYTLVAS